MPPGCRAGCGWLDRGSAARERVLRARPDTPCKSEAAGSPAAQNLRIGRWPEAAIATRPRPLKRDSPASAPTFRMVFRASWSYRSGASSDPPAVWFHWTSRTGSRSLPRNCRRSRANARDRWIQEIREWAAGWSGNSSRRLFPPRSQAWAARPPCRTDRIRREPSRCRWIALRRRSHRRTRAEPARRSGSRARWERKERYGRDRTEGGAARASYRPAPARGAVRPHAAPATPGRYSFLQPGLSPARECPRRPQLVICACPLQPETYPDREIGWTLHHASACRRALVLRP